MAIVEEVSEEEHTGQPGPRSAGELLRVVQELSKRLALPEDLLPSFLNEDKRECGVTLTLQSAGAAEPELRLKLRDLASAALEIYKDHAISVLRQIQSHVGTSAWGGMSLENQATVMLDVTHLYGSDPWTSQDIKRMIDGKHWCNWVTLTEELSLSMDRPAIALHLLTHPIRTWFANPHPMLNPETARAMARPAGGSDAMMDFHDAPSQPWKHAAAWGCHNVLRWSVSQLDAGQVEARIGVILPPTLTLMDDWEPPWRGRGVSVMESWVNQLDEITMKRMGMDRLLLNSLLHTLELNPSPPLPHVLPATLRLIERTTDGANKAEILAEVMQKAIVSGWTYAPSGPEGRGVLVEIAKEVEKMCDVLGTGIARWLKASPVPHEE